MGFRAEIKSIVETLRDMRLRVLIWGPGKNRPEDEYKKREKLRTAIKDHFPNAEVFFSEDEELKKTVPGAQYLPPHEEQRFHLAGCNVCIVLNTSPSTVAEISYFMNSSLAPKLFVLTREKDRNTQGFIGGLLGEKNQKFFSQDMWISCHLTELAVTHVTAFAMRSITQESPDLFPPQ